MKQCKVTHNILTSDNNFNSYDTAVLASFIRNQMIVQGISFSCETVFSHEGKLDLIKEATKHNYRTYLYFCCAGDADTCVERVKQRVEEGGHDVPVEKIKGRFSRTLENLRPALSLVNRAYLFDNSGKEFELIVEKEEHKIEIKTSSVPNWISKYLLEKLND